MNGADVWAWARARGAGWASRGKAGSARAREREREKGWAGLVLGWVSYFLVFLPLFYFYSSQLKPI